jgi:hypothetical protein
LRGLPGKNVRRRSAATPTTPADVDADDGETLVETLDRGKYTHRQFAEERERQKRSMANRSFLDTVIGYIRDSNVYSIIVSYVTSGHLMTPVNDQMFVGLTGKVDTVPMTRAQLAAFAQQWPLTKSDPVFGARLAYPTPTRTDGTTVHLYCYCYCYCY